MESKTSNQKGFTLVESLLVILVVLVAGFIGYYVYGQNKPSTYDTQLTSHQKGSTPTSGSSKVAYADLPADTKQAIFAAATSDQPLPDCYKGLNVETFGVQEYQGIKLTYDPSGYVFAGISHCDGGSLHLFVKQNGIWKDVAQTQDLFDCSMLKSNHVPRQLLYLENTERYTDPGELGGRYDCTNGNATVQYQG